MKYLVIIASLIAVALYHITPSGFIGAGENSEITINEAQFPSLVGINLQGEKQELPQAFAGKLIK